MAVIKYEDLFDFPGYQKAIKDAESANKEFGKTVESINARIGKQYNEIKTELNDYVGVLKSFNVNQKGASDSIIRTGESALAAAKKIAEQKRIMMELVGTTDLTGKSVNELKTGLKGLESQYNSIAGKSDDARAKKAALAAEARRVTSALKEQTTILKTTSQVLNAAEGSYQALQLELSSVGKQLKAMPDAFDKVTGKINLNNKEAARLQQRYLEVNNVLKTADAQLGNYQRNVGNYASATNSLSQVLRELPSLGINAQTFFLAISNNLPILFDQFSKVKNEVDAVTGKVNGSGKAFKIFAQSIFSVGNLLTIGVTLLTLYGKQLTDFIGGLFKGGKGLSAMAQAQRDVNKAMQEANTSVGGQIGELEALYEVTQNSNIALDDRVDATKRIIEINKENNERTGETTKLLTDQNGVLREQPDLIDKISDSLLRQAKTKAVLNLIEEAYSKVLKAQTATLNSQTNALQDVGLKGLNLLDDFFGGGRTPDTKQVQESIKNKGIADANAYLEAVKKILNEGLASGEYDLSGVITGSSKGAKKGGKSAEESLAEKIKKQQELLKSALENAIALDELNYQKGLITEEEFQINKLELIKKYTDAAIELENKKGKKADQKTINDFNKERISAEAYYLKFINELTDQNRKEDLERAKEAIKAEADLKVEQLMEEKQLVLASKTLTDIEREALEIDYQNRADQILIESLKRRIDLETDAAKKLILEKERLALQNSIRNRNTGFDKSTLDKEYKAKVDAENKAFQLISAGRDVSYRDQMAHLKRLEKIQQDYADRGVDITKDAEERKYQEMLLNAEREKALRQEIEETLIQGIQQGLEIAQNLVNAKFDERIAQLEEQKKKELELAGNNAAARSAIEEQYQKKIAEQKNKQAKSERSFALFNVAINTAMGVTKSIAQWGMPQAIPFIALTVIQGALQAAAILSKPLPKYKKGRKGGPAELAIVDEAGPELIVDKSGRLKEVGGGGARITTLAQGDSVIPAGATREILKSGDRDKILSELSLTARMSSSLRTGKQEEMVHIMARAMQSGQINQEALEMAFEKAIKKLPHTDFFFDERGFYKRKEEQGRRTTYLNDLTKI